MPISQPSTTQSIPLIPIHHLFRHIVDYASTGHGLRVGVPLNNLTLLVVGSIQQFSTNYHLLWQRF
jgi:hypothetical protein